MVSEAPENRQVVVFTKPARPGRVKTRLIGDLSAEQTAALHEAFLEDLLETLRGGPFDLTLAWDLDSHQPVPATELPGFRQATGDLGSKLFHGLGRAAKAAQYVAAVGSDHPDLEVSRVCQAFEALEAGADLAIGPARDGGYYLIAMNRVSLSAALFDAIPWSSDRVFATTLERADRLGLHTEVLPEGQDVDNPDDLRRLSERISMGAACPRTQHLLQSWDLLSFTEARSRR